LTSVEVEVPRVSREVAEQSRADIIRAAARLFRERGLQNVSIDDLMGEAGLTRGGFYGHFQSKDELAAVACTSSFDDANLKWCARAVAADPDARTALVEGYLSTQGRTGRKAGCPIATLVNDVAREPGDAPVREAYVAGLEGLLAILVDAQATGDRASDRRAALADVATMIGAVLLAKAVDGHGLSQEVMIAARERLLEPVATPAVKRARRAGS
jgi:TetR/AcrR family transcriptional regulator, transcriptional repressor for nem operon